jgi:hypothetical protein
LVDSISPTRVVKQSLKVKQFLIDRLEQSNVSADIGRVILDRSTPLEHGEIVIERGCCSIRLPPQGKVRVHLNSLEKVTIQLKQEIFLALGVRVEQMGTGGRTGTIREIVADRALVKWGGHTLTWHPLYELYPLDESGKPIIPKGEANIFQTALRARISLAPKLVEVRVPQPDVNQLELF